MLELHNNLPFLPERMKIEKVENLHDKPEYVINIRNLMIKVIKFNQNAWLKPYIDMNTNLREKAKTILKMIFLS